MEELLNDKQKPKKIKIENHKHYLLQLLKNEIYKKGVETHELTLAYFLFGSLNILNLIDDSLKQKFINYCLNQAIIKESSI